MIADDPSQWTSNHPNKYNDWEQSMVVVLRSYIRKRVAEGQDIECLRRDMLAKSLYPEILIKIFNEEITRD